MTRLVCEEFDEFVEALAGLRGQYVLRTKPARDWRLRSVDLNGITLMAGREGAARIYNGTGQDAYFHTFLLLTGHQCVTIDGRPFDRSDIAWITPGRVFHARTSRPIRWLNVAVSTEHVLRWAENHPDEFDFSLLERNLLGPAHPSTVSLVRLAHRLFQVDAHSPDELHTPAAEHAARVEVLDTVLRTVLPIATSAAQRRHSDDHKQMLLRALERLEKLEDTIICTADLCTAVGASERTVRNIFNSYLGMSPHRYLMTRRLHAIRSVIRHADQADTITNICARYGVWDFGRFAKLYQEHFGALPSHDLQARRRSHPDRVAATRVH